MKKRPRNDGLHTPGYWRERAEEAQGMADGMVDLRAKAALEAIAYKYRFMAELATDRRSGQGAWHSFDS